MLVISCPSLDRLPDPEDVVKDIEALETEGKRLRQLLRLLRDRQVDAKARKQSRTPGAKEASRVAS